MKDALFSFPKEAVHSQNTTLPDKDRLFEKIRERDLSPVVSLNAEDAFDETGVQAHELIDDKTTRPIGHIAIDEVGVIVNRLDRSFERGTLGRKMPEAWKAAALPILNENAMRSLAHFKDRMYRDVLKPLELGIPTAIVSNAYEVALFATINPAERYIIKPNSGSNNTDIHPVSDDEAIAMFAQTVPKKEMIMQPCYDFTLPFHPSVKPYDASAAEDFESWNKSGTIKEFRMYSFLGPSSLTMFPVARAFTGTKTHWMYVDPESLPDKVYHDTERVMRRAATLSGSRALYAVRDFGYGRLHSDDDPDYHTVEINGRMPHMIGYHQHPAIADTLREHMADQLKDTVDNT